MNNSNRGGIAQPIKSCHVMRGNRSCGVNFLSYPGSGGEESEGCGRGFSARLSDRVLFFLSPRGTRRRVGKSYLESVLKEIHVGTNPDIIEDAP